jgi:hypothetical protein
MKKIEKLWEKDEKKILAEIENASGMKWKEKEIICYLVSRAIPFSDPLTMPVYKNKQFFIDILVHELIHRIFVQNNKDFRKKMQIIIKKFPDENWNVKIHILLDIIHKKIYEKFNWQKRMQNEINYFKKLRDYKKAWNLALQY